MAVKMKRMGYLGGGGGGGCPILYDKNYKPKKDKTQGTKLLNRPSQGSRIR